MEEMIIELTKQNAEELILASNVLQRFTLECLRIDNMIQDYVKEHNVDNQDEELLMSFHRLINHVYLDYLHAKQKFNTNKVYVGFVKDYVSFAFVDRNITALLDTYKDMIHAFLNSDKGQLSVALSYYPQSTASTYQILLSEVVEMAYTIEYLVDPDIYEKQMFEDVLDDDDMSKTDIFYHIFTHISNRLKEISTSLKSSADDPIFDQILDYLDKVTGEENHDDNK